VQTLKLKTAFEKYLPAVLNSGAVKKEEKTVLSESREVTGDKTAKAAAQETAKETNVVALKRLAGLK
jgi:hypothetical protein